MTKAMAQVNSDPCRPRRHLLRCTGARATARCENGSAVLEAWRLGMAALSFASAFRDCVFREHPPLWVNLDLRRGPLNVRVADDSRRRADVLEGPECARRRHDVTTGGLLALRPYPGAGRQG